MNDIREPRQNWEEMVSVFQFKTFEKDGLALPYRFYPPPHLESGKKYPLMLLMHGAGETGTDNRDQLSKFRGIAFWESHPCIVIAPQCPKPVPGIDNEQHAWVQTNFSASSHTMKEKPSWPMQLTMVLLDKTISENPVDEQRVYVTGLSMGAFATWELLQRQGDKFAAAAPVCGGADLAVAQKLINLPLWVFHGDADEIVPVKRSRDIVAAIIAAGGHPKYTEYPGIDHDAWTSTYTNSEVWDWLFAQRLEF